MTDFSRIKKLLRGSTTMPSSILGHGHQHKADGSCCGHDHSHDHGHGDDDHNDHQHHKDGSCCHGTDDCAHTDHGK